MDKETLLKLADEIERAAAPVRGLDAEIAIAFNAGSLPGARKKQAGDYAHQLGLVLHEWEGGTSHQDSLRYTGSMDAAMELAEPFLLVQLGDIAADGLPAACLVADTSTSPVVDYWGIGAGHDRLGCLARALTAAALRAHASVLP